MLNYQSNYIRPRTPCLGAWAQALGGRVWDGGGCSGGGTVMVWCGVGFLQGPKADVSKKLTI